jgi:DNA-binding CsgD family transcriptional regulator
VVVAADDSNRVAIVRDALARLGEDPAVLDEAETAGLLRLEAGSVRLSHPILRPVAYHQVAVGSRRAAHRALAAALDAPDDAVARAWQLAAAADGPDEVAAGALQLVARDVRRRGGAASAARVLERAALLSPGVSARDDRSLAAAEAWLDAGDPERARAAVPPTRTDPPSAARLTREVEIVRWSESPTAARQRLHDAGPRATPWARALEADLVFEVSGAEAAADAAARLGDHEPAEPLGSRLAGLVAFRAGGGEPGDDEVAEIPADPSSLDPCRRLLAVRALQARAEAGKALGEREPTTPTSSVEAAVARAQASRHQGRVSAAFDQLFAELALLPEPAGRRRAVVEVWLADTAQLLGRDPDARAHLAPVAALVPGEIGAPERAAADWVEGRLARSAGDVARSLTSLEPAAITLPHLYGPELIVALVAADRYPEAERWLERVGATDHEHPVARTRADRARGAFRGDVDLFNRSIQSAVDHHLPIEAAESRLALAEHLARAGQTSDARGAGEAASRELAALGVAGWAARLATVTEAATDDSTVQAELTAAEYRVAVTVAEGGKNREVAEALFLSVKTVDFHLQNIYRKLGLRSRTELAVRLSRDGSTVAERESTP